MTTDRPYRPAMTVEQAAAEVQRCRGTQFAPAVVDAFFAAFRRQPAVFAPDEPDEPLQIAVGA
jgi:HD-GYP domain-containing protein (c-di-GMP phosphodiesterase class II)